MDRARVPLDKSSTEPELVSSTGRRAEGAEVGLGFCCKRGTVFYMQGKEIQRVSGKADALD